MAYMMDFFAANSEAKVLAAIDNSVVQYPAYVFIRNEDGKTGRLGFVDQNNVFKYIVGEESKKQVVHVDVLPSVDSADIEVLYICDSVVYVFNGTEFVPTYKDHTAEIDALELRITNLETKVGKLEASDADLAEQITALNKKVDAIEIPEECKCIPDNKYEITNTPVGTLVDYRDKEIRVMCPADAVFTKQNVGSTGNANMYYMAFKAYAPKDAVSFKEGDQGVIKDEMFTFDSDFAGTDEFGRNYSICWLALASYNETNGWTYFGAKSTVEKYVGWTYVVEWYNADGVVISYDSVRINLSNESCHTMLEPFYISDLTSDIAALQKTVEELEGNAGAKFIELE